jgi:hypothetical protein
MITAAQRVTAFRWPGRRSVVALLLVVATTAVALIAWEQRQQSQPSAVAPKPAPSVTGSVVIEGGPPVLQGQSDIHPVRSARLVIVGVTMAGARITRHVRADGSGHFALSLPPGVYTITARIFGPANKPLNMQPHERVVVRRGQPVHVRIKGSVV